MVEEGSLGPLSVWDSSAVLGLASLAYVFVSRKGKSNWLEVNVTKGYFALFFIKIED